MSTEFTKALEKNDFEALNNIFANSNNDIKNLNEKKVSGGYVTGFSWYCRLYAKNDWQMARQIIPLFLQHPQIDPNRFTKNELSAFATVCQWKEINIELMREITGFFLNNPNVKVNERSGAASTRARTDHNTPFEHLCANPAVADFYPLFNDFLSNPNVDITTPDNNALTPFSKVLRNPNTNKGLMVLLLDDQRINATNELSLYLQANQRAEAIYIPTLINFTAAILYQHLPKDVLPNTLSTDFVSNFLKENFDSTDDSGFNIYKFYNDLSNQNSVIDIFKDLLIKKKEIKGEQVAANHVPVQISTHAPIPELSSQSPTPVLYPVYAF